MLQKLNGHIKGEEAPRRATKRVDLEIFTQKARVMIANTTIIDDAVEGLV